MYYTVIKHSGHLRTLDKCREHLPVACVLCISLVFSNDHRVFISQCNTRLRLLYLLKWCYDEKIISFFSFDFESIFAKHPTDKILGFVFYLKAVYFE